MIKNIEEVSCAFLHDVDLLCFSHLRWGFVFQRPNHLLTRFSKHQRVFFFEEPVFHANDDKLHFDNYNDNLNVVTPHLKHRATAEEVQKGLKKILSSLLRQMQIKRFYSWYYT